MKDYILYPKREAVDLTTDVNQSDSSLVGKMDNACPEHLSNLYFNPYLSTRTSFYGVEADREHQREPF